MPNMDYYNDKRLQRNPGVLTPMEEREIYLPDGQFRYSEEDRGDLHDGSLQAHAGTDSFALGQ